MPCPPPSNQLDQNVLALIEVYVGRPCPTRKTISQWTGLSRRSVWDYLQDMDERGLIEIEVQGSYEQGRDPKRRRMRRAGGFWTGWTQRGPAWRPPRLSARTA